MSILLMFVSWKPDWIDYSYTGICQSNYRVVLMFSEYLIKTYFIYFFIYFICFIIANKFIYKTKNQQKLIHVFFFVKFVFMFLQVIARFSVDFVRCDRLNFKIFVSAQNFPGCGWICLRIGFCTEEKKCISEVYFSFSL